MSGIFGFWNLDGRPADPALLMAMGDVLAHRGPDGADYWYRGPVAIGHRMLRATPESLYEHQPLACDAPSRVLTADVRLDNRDTILQRLGLSDRPASGLPDAELLLRGHARYGAALASQLLGAFALAVWDEHGRELFCARDHFGEKPLYYFHAPGRLFAFASEIKALLELDEVPDDIDETQVARHLLIPVAEDPAATYYRFIRRLLPGHTLSVTPIGVDTRPYWTLDPDREVRLSSDDEYAEAVRDAFLAAVQARLRSAGPIATMLSGGIDSSSITSAAARLLRESGDDRRLRTLSAVYPSVPQSDERPFMQKVLDAYDVEPSFFDADGISPVADIHRLNWYGDGANSAGNLYLNERLYRTAAESGARVVLDGFDGDSTVSHGKGWLVELADAGRWWTLLREVKASARNNDEDWVSAVRAWIVGHGIKPLMRRVRPRRRHRPAGPPRQPEWGYGLSPDFRSVIAAAVGPTSPAPRTEKEHHYRLLTKPLIQHALSWVEAVGAGNGVEVRFPFFDVRLVELCLALPPEQKLRRGQSRYVMRQAMRGILPEAIRSRPGKSNLEPGFHHALRTHADARIRNVLQGSPELRRFLDPTACTALHARVREGTATPMESLRHWRLASLALWLNPGPGHTPPANRRTDRVSALVDRTLQAQPSGGST